MKRSPHLRVFGPGLLLAAALLGRTATAQETVYAVTTANNLVAFRSTAPGAILSTVAITGLQAAESVLGIDFRPANGALFALGSTSRLYTLNPTTGLATQVGTAGAFTLTGTSFGMDFNPVPDRIRIVSDAEQNIRLNPDNGVLAAVDTALAYAPGDPNFGVNPNVVGAAYTNNFPGGAALTTLYVVDSGLDVLARQGGPNGTPSPNGGQLFTIGSLGVNTSGLAGFDVSATGVAYAALTVAAASSFYRINLATGAATFVGTIGGGVNIRGIAVVLPTKGDFSGDAKTDILFRHQVSGRNVVWFMDGITRTAGVFTNPDTLPDTNWQMAGTSDFNADAKTDILFRHAVSGKNVVWLMDGITRTAGVFTNPDTLPDTNWRVVGTGDFSSPTDGKPDLLFRHSVSGKNVVWFMDGITRTAGVFTNPDTLADTNWRMVGVGDFSSPRDAKADILWRHVVSGKNVVWFMDGITRTAGVFTNPDTLPDTNWTMAAVGDYSRPRDGKPDVLFRHQVSGKNVVWFMDGITRTAGVFTNPDTLPDTNWRIVGPK